VHRQKGLLAFHTQNAIRIPLCRLQISGRDLYSETDVAAAIDDVASEIIHCAFLSSKRASALGSPSRRGPYQAMLSDTARMRAQVVSRKDDLCCIDIRATTKPPLSVKIAKPAHVGYNPVC
jgi:hypothetical protein